MKKKRQANILKFLNLPGTEKLILVRGLILSFIFYGIVRLLPLKYYIDWLKSKSIDDPMEFNADCDHRIITKNISRLEKIVPWHMTCLNKVITARYLYKSLGIESSIQLSLFDNNSGKKCAHASLLVNGTFEYLAVNKDVRRIFL